MNIEMGLNPYLERLINDEDGNDNAPDQPIALSYLPAREDGRSFYCSPVDTVVFQILIQNDKV